MKHSVLILFAIILALSGCTQTALREDKCLKVRILPIPNCEKERFAGGERIVTYLDSEKKIGAELLNVCNEHQFSLYFENSEEKPTNCEEFYETIEDYNKTCNGCLITDTFYGE